MSNRRNLILLFFTLVVVMMGFGMVIPILPFYIDSFGASGSAMGLLMASYAVMQFLFAPIWGQLSDRFGRKPMIVMGVLGNALSQLLFGLSTQLWMLFAARILSGILSSATMPSAMAYIGDSTSDQDRGGGMGIVGAAMGVGMVLGPGIAGTMAEISLPAPFFAAAGLSTLAAFLILILLPESLPPAARDQPTRSLRGPDLGGMWRALSSPIAILLLLAFLVSFGLTNFESVFGLYALERFDYGPQEVGFILTVIGLTSAIVQGGLTGPFTRKWGEVTIIRACLLGSVGGFMVLLLAWNYITVMLTSAIFILSNSMLRPAVSSLISKRSISGQGIAMGLNNAFMSLGRIVGPILAGMVFDLHLSLPYISGAVIMLIGFIICLRWLEAEASFQPTPFPAQD